MAQFSNTALSNSVVSVQSGPCQLTSYSIYNPNTTDIWVKFQDSADTTSAATGITSVYKVLVPASSQVIDRCDSGQSIDPDGMWAFATGMTCKCVTGYLHGNTTPPTTPIEIYIQTKP